MKQQSSQGNHNLRDQAPWEKKYPGESLFPSKHFPLNNQSWESGWEAEQKAGWTSAEESFWQSPEATRIEFEVLGLTGSCDFKTQGQNF